MVSYRFVLLPHGALSQPREVKCPNAFKGSKCLKESRVRQNEAFTCLNVFFFYESTQPSQINASISFDFQRISSVTVPLKHVALPRTWSIRNQQWPSAKDLNLNPRITSTQYQISCLQLQTGDLICGFVPFGLHICFSTRILLTTRGWLVFQCCSWWRTLHNN